MKKLINSLVLLCVAVPLARGVTAGTNSAVKPADKLDGLFDDPVIVKAKGLAIKRSELDQALIGLKASASARGQTIPPAQLAAFEQQILQRLIQVALLNNKATDADKAAGKEVADKRVAEIKGRFATEEMLDTQLKSIGLTREELSSKMTEEAIAEAVLKREIKTDVTDDSIKKYYDEHPTRFEEPETVRVQHVLLSIKDPQDTNPDPRQQRDLPEDKKQAKRKQAEDIMKRARAGEDFTKLAETYSEDPGVKVNKGEYKFSQDDPFVPEFKTAAFALTNNQVSDIVTTMFGYHIIKLLEKTPAKKVDFTEVKDNLKESLTQQAIQKQLPDYIDKLQKDAGVQILDDKLKPAPMDMPELPPSLKAPADAPKSGK